MGRNLSQDYRILTSKLALSMTIEAVLTKRVETF